MNFRIYISLLCLLLSANGCFLLVAGTGIYAGMEYVNGALTYQVAHPVSQAHEAGLMALRDLDLMIMDDDIAQHEALIKFEYDDGAWGRIYIDAVTERVSEIKIRVGTFGDEAQARIVQEALAKYLTEVVN